MPVKMTGAQYKAFLASDWGPDAMWEDTEILRNGSEVDPDNDSSPEHFADTDVVTIVSGTITPDQRLPPSQIEFIDAVKFAKRWLKAQTTVTLMVDVPREHAERFAQMIQAIGINHEMAKVIGRVG